MSPSWDTKGHHQGINNETTEIGQISAISKSWICSKALTAGQKELGSSG
jgi:hypothetical protein